MPSPYMPMAMPIFSRGTIWYTIVNVTTGRMPPGTACSTRNAMRLPRLQARPHSAEPAANPSRVTR
jgi:hypothetical protein